MLDVECSIERLHRFFCRLQDDHPGYIDQIVGADARLDLTDEVLQPLFRIAASPRGGNEDIPAIRGSVAKDESEQTEVALFLRDLLLDIAELFHELGDDAIAHRMGNNAPI